MLSKNLISSVLTQIPVFFLGVLSGVFSTRLLGDEGKGVFSLIQANMQLFVLIFSIGIQTGVVYFISSKKISEQLVIGMATTVFLINSFLLLALLLVSYILNLNHLFLPYGYTQLFYLAFIFIMYLFSFLNSLFSSVFQAHSKFKTINFISIANSIINVVLFSTLFFVSSSQLNNPVSRLNIILFITTAVLFINTLMWVYYYNKHINIKPSFNFEFKHQFKTFLSYNSSIYIGMFINFFNYRLDLWIVNHYLPEKDLSYYSLAANINQIILYLSVTIASVLLPNLSGKTEEERVELFIKVSRICFIFFGVIILTAYLLSSFIIPFMYGNEFENTVIPFQIILPGMLFSCITQLFSIFIVSANRNIFNIIACSFGLVFTLILDLILIPKIGINGASIATSLSYFIIFLLSYIFVIYLLNKKTLNLFIPKRHDLSMVINLVKKQIK